VKGLPAWHRKIGGRHSGCKYGQNREVVCVGHESVKSGTNLG